MKKLIALFAVTIISLTSYSQSLDNEFYFRFGYSSPSWEQFGFTQRDWNDEGFDTKMGGSFEIGNIFMFKRLTAAENMAFGINVDYLYVVVNQYSNSNTPNGTYFGHTRFGTKMGPSFSYSPVNKLVFDIYAKLDIAWATVATQYEGEIGNADDYYAGYVTPGFSTGMNIRYGVLMLGVEFNTLSPKLESDDNPGEFVGNFKDSSDKSPIPCMNFTLGLSF